MRLYERIQRGNRTTINLDRIEYLQLADNDTTVVVHFGNDDLVRFNFDSAQDASEHYQQLHDLMSV